MIRNMFGGASKCRTIDKVDIFGDSSGVALYQLDGNANDTGGVYHGTETAITYGGGVYERAISSAGVAKLQTGLFNYNTPNSISFFAQGQVRYENGRNAIALPNLQITNTAVTMFSSNSTTGSEVVSVNIAINEPCTVFTHIVVTINYPAVIVYINGVQKYSGTMSGTTTASVYASGFFDIGGFGVSYTGMVDQVRIFNRAVTATEVATLYAECAPSSTVDNINPFMDGSMKALYKLDGDATDATGVYNGTATNVTYGTGKFGQCAVFNGTAYVTTSLHTVGTSCSISFFIKLNNRNNSLILFNGSTSQSYLFASTTGSLIFQTEDARYAEAAGFGFLDTTTWTHVTVTKEGSTVSFYRNGTKIVSTNTGNGGIISTSSFVYNRISGASWMMNGSIDQLRIFNKALTPLEVASLYNETTPLEEPMYKLVDPFRDGSGKALYRLEGNALDESGNYNGTATSVTYGTGQFGRAGVFNGSAYVYNASIGTTTNFTHSFWYKSTVTTQNIPLSVGSGGYADLLFVATSTNLQVSFAAGTKYRQFTVSSVNDGQWHHICSTSDGTTCSLHLDGVSITGGTTQTANTVIGTGVYVGRTFGATPNYTNGTLDQVRIFNRALTAGEVSSLYLNENNVI